MRLGLKENKHIGIIGGTFNPIHMGHLILAEHAWSEFKLDEILFIPTGVSYFKDPSTVASKKDRLNMTSEAIMDNPHFALSTIETDRPGNSYTYETLEMLKSSHQNYTFYLIVGADTLFQIDQWKNPESIMKNSIILASIRKGQSKEDLEKRAQELMEKYGADIRILEFPYIDISSTDIRNRIASGKSVKYMLHDSTLNYIEKNKLYIIDNE